MTRSELYALVWSQPVSKLAPLLGISTCGLAKTCQRHSIPTPSHGYWAKLAAGQKPSRVELPPQTVDEVLPRFRELDASGRPVQRGSGAWLIPGILRRAPQLGDSAAPLPASLQSHDGAPLPAAMVAAPLPGPTPAQDASQPDQVGRQRKMRRPAAAVKPEEQVAPGPRVDSSAPARPAASPPELVVCAAAIDAECERAAAAAMTHHQHQVLRTFLAAVAMRASQEDASTARAVLTWVSAVRRRLEDDDPVVAVLNGLRASSQSGREPLWAAQSPR